MRLWLAVLGMAVVLGAATPPKKTDRIVIVKTNYRGTVSGISRKIEAGILCSPDCVAEREGFESASQRQLKHLTAHGQQL